MFMRNLQKIFIFSILAIFACIPAAKAAPCPTGNIPPSVILGKNDDSRLKMAESLMYHLENQGVAPDVIKTIYKASLRTGVDFELLVLKARMESDFGQFNVAAGSSARGLFQYIEPTWLTLMHRYGAEMGYPHYAEAIKFSRGLPYVKNKYLKAEILALRHDQDASTLIKAYQVQEETDVIRGLKRGQRVTAADHYISHMLGLSLARELYDLRARNSVFALALLDRADMREAAKLNRAFFYDGKTPLAAVDVYKNFEQRVNREIRSLRRASDIELASAQSCAPDQDIPETKISLR